MPTLLQRVSGCLSYYRDVNADAQKKLSIRMKLFIHLLLIILIGGCTKEIISSSSIPEFIFSAAYFDYNVNSNQMYFYTEIENVNNITIIDSVWAFLYNSGGEKVDSVKLNSEYQDSNFILSEKIYTSKIAINELNADVYHVIFILWDDSKKPFTGYSEEKFITTNTTPAAPEIISYAVPDTFIIDATDWTILNLELNLYDKNGLEDITRVEYKTLRLFNGCTVDNNNDGTISEAISDDGYTNLGFEDWLFNFDQFGANNSFIYFVEIPMRPLNGAALFDNDGNVILGYEATDCGRIGDVFFQFQVTDRTGFTASVEDIHLEIIAP